MNNKKNIFKTALMSCIFGASLQAMDVDVLAFPAQSSGAVETLVAAMRELVKTRATDQSEAWNDKAGALCDALVSSIDRNGYEDSLGDVPVELSVPHESRCVFEHIEREMKTEAVESDQELYLFYKRLDEILVDQRCMLALMAERGEAYRMVDLLRLLDTSK